MFNSFKRGYYKGRIYKVNPPSTAPSSFAYVDELPSVVAQQSNLGRLSLTTVDRHSPLSTVSVYLPLGSRYENVNSVGGAHWAKHMLLAVSL
jgi:hypothetical protein